MARRVQVPLRWGDLDAQGHINNAAFADYLQEARADCLVGTPAEQLLHTGLVVVNQQIEYTAPALFATEPLAVDVAPCAVGAAKLTLAYTVWQGETEVARARTQLCPYDLETSKPRRLQPAERQWLASQAEPAAPFRKLSWRPMNKNARTVPMRVRWSDLDAYGHVNNVLFFNYIMEGRIAFTAAAVQDMNDSVHSGYLWFVVRQDVDYLSPMHFRTEPYTVRTGVAHMGNTSLTFCSEISDPAQHKRFAKASTVAVFADSAGKPTPVLPEWKAALEPFRLV
jgi:acyl-CoA thioester hydrolase